MDHQEVAVVENSKIEWTDHTFNPWVGCTKISPACANCYAEGWAKRTGHADLWTGERRRTSAENWRQPLKWNKEAAASGIRRKVFCASLADVFDNQVPVRWRDDLWHYIAMTPYLDWLLLTKRPQNIAKMLPTKAAGHPEWGDGWPNVWLGTTVENQTEADRRIPDLLSTPAAVRFLSCEPLLGPVDIRQWQHDYGCGCGWGGNSPLSYCNECGWRGDNAYYGEPCPECGETLADYNACPECDGHDGDGMSFGPNSLPRVDWVICGGESGPHARPMHPEWARGLRDQCKAAGVPFLFKQWGEWHPDALLYTDIHGTCPPPHMRIGKAKSGRLLDGVLWDERP
jgi:protein gp37